MADSALTKKLQLKGRRLVLLNLPERLDGLFPEDALRADEMPENADAAGRYKTEHFAGKTIIMG